MALRWRVTLIFALVMAGLLAAVWLQLRQAVLRDAEAGMRDRLLAEAALAADLAPPPPWTPGESLSQWAQGLDDRLGARVTLIDPDGIVIADTRYSPASMENHADRPERLHALARGWGSSVRKSRTLGRDMLYVAVALEPPGDGRPVLRLALPLTAVEETSRHLRSALLLALGVVAALVLLALPWISGVVAAPVERIVSVARRVARGDLEARVSGRLGGELGELADVFNSAVDRLSGLLRASQEEARRYAAILEQMSDAVVIVDVGGRVALVNAAFARVFRVDPEAARGRFLDRVALNYELSELLARTLRQGAPQRNEVRLLHPEVRTFVGSAAPLREEHGAVTGAVALLHDITDVHRLDRVRQEFVANASHELRTPAAGIKALAEALQAGALADPERGPDFVNRIVEATDRLAAILDDMLVLTRVERGQELLRPQWVPVAQACSQAVSHIAQRAEATGVALGLEASEKDRVWADPGTLHTVLLNLLDNAVKYTPRGGRIDLRGRRVASPAGCELSVADTGVGIPEQHQGRVFERFYRVDKARDRATGGTGLGLSIVKHSVEAHGGRVSLRSRPGEGSTFTVFLPDPTSGPRPT